MLFTEHTRLAAFAMIRKISARQISKISLETNL